MLVRRRLLLALAASALPLPASAQQKKMFVIGYLAPIVPPDPRLDAFKQGMRDLGYIEGRDYRLELRWGEGKLERMPALAAEMVKLKPDVIVARSSPSVLALKKATSTIPIVMPVSSDPVGDGIVASLARPGGNITGLSQMAPELAAKRLQLLHDVIAKRSGRVSVLWNPAYTGMAARFRETKVAGPNMGMDVRSVEIRDAREMEAAFEAITRDPPMALVLLVDPLTYSMRARIVEFARERRIPTIYETRDFADAGGLISYGPNTDAQYRRAAYFVDRILKGAKPGDLPIEQPVKIELVVNRATARALGIAIPQSILSTADQVIDN